jgi:glycosyltransferase involved in cell wall biosynthesis
MPSLISIVVPVYNEKENIQELYLRLCQSVNKIPAFRFEFVFVNDGSRDGSADLLANLTRQDRRVKVINFSRNYGSHAALRAGLLHARGDAAVILSADLQDPPESIPNLISRWLEGNEVVAAVRTSRRDPLVKRLFARIFYFLFSRLADTEYPKTGSDFFLVDKKILNVLRTSVERNAFLMAQIFSVGFKRVEIPYLRAERHAGVSKWSFARRLKGAIDYFVAYSYFPLRLMSYVGLGVAMLGFVYASFIIVHHFAGRPTEGWTSLMTVILLLSGVQMLMLGTIGEYLWRTLDQVRQRPMYVIDSMIGFDRTEDTADDRLEPEASHPAFPGVRD